MTSSIRPALGAAILFSAVSSIAAPSGEIGVVVTTGRFEEPMTAAQGIDKTVIRGKEILESGVRSVAEALERFGNVQVSNDFNGAGNRTIDARGFGETASRNTLILLDGVRISENEGVNPFTAGILVERIERIEILRGGAGSVAYGEGATGGTINIVTRAASAGARDAGIRVSAGSYGSRELFGGARLATESVALFADASRRSTDNYRRNNRAESDSLSAGAKVFVGTGHVGVTVTRESSQNRLPGSLNLAQFAADPRQVAAGNINDWSDTAIERLIAYGGVDLGEVDLRADWTNTKRLNHAFAFGASSRTDSNISQFSPRLRWRPAGNQLELVAGADLSDWTALRADFGFPAGVNRGRQETRAIYLQGLYAIGNSRVEAGIRHEEFDKRNDHVNPAFAYRQTQSSRPWSIGLRHDFGSTAVFGRVGRSDRVPNIDDNNARADSTLLAVQTSRDIELGGSVHSGDLRADVRAFRHRIVNEVLFDNSIVPGFGPAGAFGANRNLPPTRRQGIEVEGRWQVARPVTLSLLYARLSARFLQGTLSGTDIGGNEIPLVARERLGLRAIWEPAPSHRFEAGFQHLSAQRYSGDYSNTMSERIPAYDLVDLGYRHRFAGGDAGVSIHNAANRRYFSVGFSFGGVPTGVYPEPGRRIVADLNLRF